MNGMDRSEAADVVHSILPYLHMPDRVAFALMPNTAFVERVIEALRRAIDCPSLPNTAPRISPVNSSQFGGALNRLRPYMEDPSFWTQAALTRQQLSSLIAALGDAKAEMRARQSATDAETEQACHKREITRHADIGRRMRGLQ